MRLGYNTNGFPQHRLTDVVAILAELGYDGIAVTPDVLQLDPFTSTGADVDAVASACRDAGLAVAVETGARFVLDPRRKHQPTLLDDDAGERERRLDMLRRCLDLAARLGAETFSFWAGTPLDGLPARSAPTGRRLAPGASEPVGAGSRDELLDRLCAGTVALLDHAAGGDVRVCFEPEPGMLVASLAELDGFLSRLGRDDLAVMLDVGHVPVTESITPAEAIHRLAPRLGGLQLDDSAGGLHEHLLPGDGEIDFATVIAAASEVGFTGLASLELPRHGHDPVRTARTALMRLKALA